MTLFETKLDACLKFYVGGQRCHGGLIADYVLGISFQYLAFPCGLIRGALANLGIVCVVTAEVNTMPACKCHIPFFCGWSSVPPPMGYSFCCCEFIINFHCSWFLHPQIRYNSDKFLSFAGKFQIQITRLWWKCEVTLQAVAFPLLFFFPFAIC